jgi:hypothetical protein
MVIVGGSFQQATCRPEKCEMGGWPSRFGGGLRQLQLQLALDWRAATIQLAFQR